MKSSIDNPSVCNRAIDWAAALSDNKRWICKVLRSRVGDPDIADDLYQEIALAVVRQTARPVEQERVAPWLYRLAIRYTVNHFRKRGRQRKLLERIEQQTGDASPFETEQKEGLHWLLHCEQQQMVSDAMAGLPAQDREILLLKYTENWTYHQLAQHLGVGLNTIEYRLLRAKKRLRQSLTSMAANEVRI